MRDNRRAVRLQVGQGIRRLRMMRGWSQEQLAERVGNTYKHIGQIERGEVNVTLDILSAIAAGFSVGLQDLFPPSRPPSRPSSLPVLTPEDLDAFEQMVRTVKRLRRRMRRQAAPGPGRRPPGD